MAHSADWLEFKDADQLGLNPTTYSFPSNTFVWEHASSGGQAPASLVAAYKGKVAADIRYFHDYSPQSFSELMYAPLFCTQTVAEHLDDAVRAYIAVPAAREELARPFLVHYENCYRGQIVCAEEAADLPALLREPSGDRLMHPWGAYSSCYREFEGTKFLGMSMRATERYWYFIDLLLPGELGAEAIRFLNEEAPSYQELLRLVGYSLGGIMEPFSSAICQGIHAPMVGLPPRGIALHLVDSCKLFSEQVTAVLETVYKSSA